MKEMTVTVRFEDNVYAEIMEIARKIGEVYKSAGYTSPDLTSTENIINGKAQSCLQFYLIDQLEFRLKTAKYLLKKDTCGIGSVGEFVSGELKISGGDHENSV